MTLHATVDTMDVSLRPLAVDYADYRRRVVFQSCKWDPQVGDTNTIADHACVLSRATVSHLSKLAEALTSETMALEQILLERPRFFRKLGFSRKLRTALSRAPRERSNAVRVMRFDFHPTEDGWALSEVNSDVPGGFAEASVLPKLAAAHVSGTSPAGDAGTAFVSALARHTPRPCKIALVYATSFADDRQVMEFLARQFTAGGFPCVFVAPDHLRWNDDQVQSIADGTRGPIDAIVRFFPAEWLPALPSSSDWQRYFTSNTLACNPAYAVVTQSKRLPLVWDDLPVALPAWRACLPETRDPRDVGWQRDDSWLVKPALGRVGEGLAWRGGVTTKEWRRTLLGVTLAPGRWIAQRRFISKPLASRDGPRHLCIGVFTINGKTAGFYGRLSARTTIEKHAQDVAILINGETTCQ
jgi:glutathionylspermidine synthase